MKNTPFRITIEHWNTKVMVEQDRSDLTINEVAEMLVSALLAAGYTKASIDDILDYESK